MADTDASTIAAGSKRKLAHGESSDRAHGPDVAAARSHRVYAFLEAARRLEEDLIDKRDLDVLHALADRGVTLHKDGLLIEHDLQGLSKVRDYYSALFNKYDYRHISAVYGADADTDTAYCFFQDQGMAHKAGAEQEGQSAEPADHAGIVRYQFNEDMKLTDIWLLRQLSRAELQQKAHKLPVTGKPEGFNMQPYVAKGPAPSDDLVQRMVENASLYITIWADALRGCDTPAQWNADLCLRPNVHIYDMDFGTRFIGLPKFKQLLHGMHKEWQVREQSHEVALVPNDSKAFLFYTQTGTELDTNAANTIFGINLLVYDSQPDHRGKQTGLLSEVLGFRQLLRSEQIALEEEHKADPAHEAMVKCK